MSITTARACANIALVKYWGKRPGPLNLPAAGSLSLTLDALVTTTQVAFDPALAADELVLDGRAARPAELARTVELLDLVRAEAGFAARARVVSRNEFPTASGLASSASGFAALAVAAADAAGLALAPRALSILARRGSGSAARSVFGGFVRMHAGRAGDGSDAFAEPLGSPLTDRVRMVIAILGGGAPKAHGSRSAMTHTAETSPLYRAWIELVPRDLAVAEAALAEVRALRAAGRAAWATIDAGPHVKVLTTAGDAAAVAAALRTVAGVGDVMVSAAGGPAAVVERGRPA
ncbi:MAG TPA: diphosphomevalonate decarboxylase [Kofleriaceae bacterium]|nr:diphosphomevalonate decarboxylase [Kofleriaceae bacterium]